MQQPFGLSDTLRCILLNAPRGPNLACPRENLLTPPPLQTARFWRDALAQRDGRATVVKWNRTQLLGLASARARLGQRVWEVDRLCLRHPHSSKSAQFPEDANLEATPLLELLEELVEAVGWKQAERVFLRLSADSPLAPLAQRAGFFPAFSETLLEGQPAAPQSPADSPLEPLPSLDDATEYALFQLYSAATPSTVRSALGVTFDQWRDGRERRAAGSQWVFRKHGKLAAWLALRPWRGQTDAEALLRPDCPEALPPLLAQALSVSGGLRWLVPSYQEGIHQGLLRAGLWQAGEYQMLIKTVAAPARFPGLAAVEA